MAWANVAKRLVTSKRLKGNVNADRLIEGRATERTPRMLSESPNGVVLVPAALSPRFHRASEKSMEHEATNGERSIDSSSALNFSDLGNSCVELRGFTHKARES